MDLLVPTLDPSVAVCVRSERAVQMASPVLPPLPSTSSELCFGPSQIERASRSAELERFWLWGSQIRKFSTSGHAGAFRSKSVLQQKNCYRRVFRASAPPIFSNLRQKPKWINRSLCRKKVAAGYKAFASPFTGGMGDHPRPGNRPGRAYAQVLRLIGWVSVFGRGVVTQRLNLVRTSRVGGTNFFVNTSIREPDC